MANKNKLKSHNKNKNHDHNEIHIHMSDKKTKPRRRKKTTRKPRDAPTPYQTFQPAPVPIHTNRPQYLETVTQSLRENPVSSSIRVSDQVLTFSDSTPIQSRTFFDASPYLTPKSEYTPQVNVEPMTPLYSKASSEMLYKPFMDNSPIQSPGSFEESVSTTSPFRSEYAQEAYDRAYNMQENYRQKKANELDVAPIVIPKLNKMRKKVDVSLLNSEQRLKREQTKMNRAKDYASNKAMKNLSIS